MNSYHNIVFDASAFLAGLENYYNRVYTTRLVISEVKDKKSKELLDLAINAQKVYIIEPSEESYKKINEIKEKISAFKLSLTDISVAALAYEFRPSIVFTDDLMLQNLLLNLGIKYSSVKLRISIKNKKKYVYKCVACGRVFIKPYSYCPYCGNEITQETEKY